MEQFSLVTQLTVFGLVMSLISMLGAFTITMNKEKLDRFMSLFIALASGTLLGGAFFHMIPHAIEEDLSVQTTMILVSAGMLVMYSLELFLHWHHCRGDDKSHMKPYGSLILYADGLHNFLAGIGIGAGFMVDYKLGLSMWFIALIHEIPQEIGDYMVLLNSGWGKKKALAFNFFSALAFPLGMFFVYGLGTKIDIRYLIPFTAGNFIYIAASDLIPEVKAHPKFNAAVLHLTAVTLGFAILLIPVLFGFDH